MRSILTREVEPVAINIPHELAWVLQMLDFDLRAAFEVDRGSWDQLIERRLALTSLDVTTIRRSYLKQLALDDELGQAHDPRAWARGITDAFRGSPDAPVTSDEDER